MSSAQQVHKDMTPDDITVAAGEYQELLKKTGVPIQLPQLISDMERRVADLNGISVDEWKERFNAAAAPAAPATKAKAKAKPRGEVVEIDPNYFWMSDQNKTKGALWMKLRKEMHIVQNMFVVGPSGCGKTEGVKKLAEEFGLPLYKIDCASITTSDRWVGHKELVTVDGNTETRYEKSQHLKWLAAEDCEPGIVLYDEINRLPAVLLNTLIPILDGSQQVWVPDLGIYSQVHPDTMIAATANLGVGYSGTYGMDIALQDRFGTIMETTFPPADEEVRILMRRTGIDDIKARILVDIANQARAKANQQELSKYISTRFLINCAYYVGAGMKIVDAADTTFLKSFSAEGGAGSEQHIVTQLVSGKAGQN